MKTINKLIYKFNKVIKCTLSPFIVYDSNRTKIYCWTFSEALSWLPYTSEKVIIKNLYTNKVLARREQFAKYTLK